MNIYIHIEGEVFEEANSYYGLLRQATHSHADRASLSRILRRRGYTVDGDFTKAFRRTEAAR